MVSSEKSTARPAKRKRTRRSQEERRTETASRHLNAALELLLEGGYSHFRIASAAKRAGTSRGGQTYHFGTKMDLIEKAIETEFQNEVTQNQATASNTGRSDILRRGAEHTKAFLAGKLFRVCVNMLISMRPSNPLAEKVRSISVRSREPIEAAWIDRLIEAGADPETAKEAFWLLWNVQRGIATQKNIGGDPGGSDDILDFTVDLLNDYVRSKSSALRIDAT